MKIAMLDSGFIARFMQTLCMRSVEEMSSTRYIPSMRRRQKPTRAGCSRSGMKRMSWAIPTCSRICSTASIREDKQREDFTRVCGQCHPQRGLSFGGFKMLGNGGSTRMAGFGDNVNH